MATYQTANPIALVTGSGAPRVGQVIAKHLASLGCKIALHANQSVEQAEIASKEIEKDYHTDVIITKGSL